jgi:hypothetical protein
MPKSLHRACTFIIAASFAIGVSLFGSSPASAATTSYCQCVGYVQNYIGHINTYYAKDAGPALEAMGYRKSATPMGINDIVVLQPGFAGAPGAGHIAFLASYSTKGSTVSVILRGANQGNNGWWTDHGCYNVNRWSFSYSNNSGIRYYRR